MKKRILLFLVLLVLVSSIASAGIFSGVWQDYLTGRQVSKTIEREYTLNMGDEVSVDNKILKLMNIGTDGTVFITLDKDLEAHIGIGEVETIGSLKVRNIFASPPAVKSNVWHMELGTAYSIPQQDNQGRLISYDVTIKKLLDNGDAEVDVNGFSEVIQKFSSQNVNGLDITYARNYVSLIVGKDIVYNDPIDGRIIKSARQHMKVGTVYALPQYNKSFDVTVNEVLDNRDVMVDVNGFSEIIPFGTTQTVNGLDITNDGKFVTFIIGKEFVDRTSTYATLSISFEEEEVPTTMPLEILPVKEVSPEEISPEGIVTPTEPVKIISTQVCNGCLVNDVCAPFGLRKDGSYCDISKQFLLQKGLKENCENSYECKSNECKDGKCVSTYSLLESILNWIKETFGIDLIKEETDLTNENQTSNICVPLIENGPSEHKVDIVFVPDDYMDTNELFSDDTFSFKTRVIKFIDYNSRYGGLFSKEPFKSNKDLFNVYMMNINEDKDCQIPGESGGDQWGCKLWAEEKAKLCPASDSIIVLSNDLSGTGGQSGYAFTGMNFAQITPFSINKEEALKYPELYLDPWISTFVHEFGHSFGTLKDEYYTQNVFDDDPSQYPNCDSFGCPKWCSETTNLLEPQYEECSIITNQQDCENTNFNPPCEWTQVYGNDVCRGTFSEQNFGIDCLDGHGCYQGCEGLNGYRSELGCNIMGGKCTGNEDRSLLEFSPRGEEVIKQVINNLS